MKSNSGQNLKLGILIVAGLTIFTLGVYFIGNKQNLFGDSILVSSVFKNVNGLQSGNNVRYSGVNVGTVKEIKFLNDTAICVDMLINREAGNLIKNNALATINSDGLVGSMVLNILPSSQAPSPTIKEGDTVKRTGNIASVPVGDAVIGRVLNAVGQPLDGEGPVPTDTTRASIDLLSRALPGRFNGADRLGDANQLTLAGERKISEEAEDARYHRREREAGRFSRAVALPGDIDPDNANAKLIDGILTVTIPKAEKARPRQISVQ